jgi:type III secretory pathway component EscR
MNPESDSASNIVIQTLISLVVLVIVFCSALLGMLLSRILPQNHLTDQTKSVVTVSMGVVGTLTALVLGLLIAAAASSFNTKNQEVILIAADVIRVDRLLRRYGPEAEPLRDLLRRYTAMKIQDLFAEGTNKLPSLENPRTVALLEELQDRLVAFDASNPNQRWLQSQALQLVSAIGGRDGFWPSRTRLGSRFRCWCWWCSG